MGELDIENPYFSSEDDQDPIQVLYDNVDAKTVQKISVNGNEVLIRNSPSAQWLAIGTIDTVSCCAAEAAYNQACAPFSQATPPAPIPQSILNSEPSVVVNVYANVTFQVTRSLPDALCWKNIIEGGASRNLIYSIQVTDQNQNVENFSYPNELEFGSSSDCKNWSEAPWVPAP
jgi:hypothetical protein